MDISPLILAIPMYFTLMGIELLYENFGQHRKTYRLNDAITNISAGTLQQLSGTFIVFIKIAAYIFVYEKLAFFHLPENVWTFALAMILWDLCYYWEHRMAHEISLFWGGHVVHHQSEEYNLSVALRQTSTGFVWGIPFFLPMALIGLSPTQMVLAGGLNLLYQFWIHTEHIKKLPAWFEWVFNTPSHHRVHHGRDPKYLDKNYAGILIIWDRMFGTFKAEEERPNYGITKPLKSWNPVYANFAHYVDLFQLVRKTQSFGDAVKVLFKPPGWQPEYLGGPQLAREVQTNYQKYDAHFQHIQGYILLQFLLALGFNAFYFFQHAQFAPVYKAAFAIWILWTALMFGFLFQYHNRWVIGWEILRLLCFPLLVYGLMTDGFALPGFALPLAVLYSIFSLVWFAWRIQSKAKLSTPL